MQNAGRKTLSILLTFYMLFGSTINLLLQSNFGTVANAATTDGTLTIEGGEAGTDFGVHDNSIDIMTDTKLKFSGSTSKEINIFNGNANLVFDGLTIESSQISCLTMASDSSPGTTATIELLGQNSLTHTDGTVFSVHEEGDYFKIVGDGNLTINGRELCDIDTASINVSTNGIIETNVIDGFNEFSKGILLSNNRATVYGEVSFYNELTIKENNNLVFNENAKLIMQDGSSITNNGYMFISNGGGISTSDGSTLTNNTVIAIRDGSTLTTSENSAIQNNGNIYAVDGVSTDGINVNGNPIETKTFVRYGDLDVVGVGTEGEDFSYSDSDNVITIKSDEAIDIIGTSSVTFTRIVIEKDKDANVTLSNVNINSSEGAPFLIEDGSGGTVNLSLIGMNKLRAFDDHAALQKNGTNGYLNIEGPGTLEATAHQGSGIGSSSWTDTQNIHIKSGTIIATSDQTGIGASGEEASTAKSIRISGGNVTAEGDSIGIGGGRYGENIVITGGTVSATGNWRDINVTTGDLIITGGNVLASKFHVHPSRLIDGSSERLYKATLTIPDTSESIPFKVVEIQQGERTISYGSDDMKTFSVGDNGKVYLWLPSNSIGITSVAINSGQDAGDSVTEDTLLFSGFLNSSDGMFDEAITAEISWDGGNSYTYDGNAVNVTAKVSNKQEVETVEVIVIDGDRTEVGNYTARAISLTGTNATHYTLISAENIEKSYEIVGIKTPVSPSKPSYKSRTSTTIELHAIEAHSEYGEVEYSIDQTNWQSSTLFTNLTPDTMYTFYARYKGTNNFSASDPSEGSTIYTEKLSVETPVIDYVNEVIKVTTSMQYRVDSGEWQNVDADISISGNNLFGKTVEFRLRDSITGDVSDNIIKVSVPNRPSAPTGLTAVGVSGETSVDGKILGTNNAMEYRKVDEGIWNETKGYSIENLAVGDYEVRKRAIEGTSFSSEPTTVTVGLGYTITGENQEFKKGSGESLTFKVDASLDQFESVQVDGKTLTKDVDYTVRSGSTIVTLLPAFLETLNSGEHVLSVNFVNGIAVTTFKIVDSSTDEGNSGSGSNSGNANNGSGGSTNGILGSSGSTSGGSGSSGSTSGGSGSSGSTSGGSGSSDSTSGRSGSSGSTSGGSGSSGSTSGGSSTYSSESLFSSKTGDVFPILSIFILAVTGSAAAYLIFSHRKQRNNV